MDGRPGATHDVHIRPGSPGDHYRPQEDGYRILSDTGAESLDSGLGYAELEIKEHPIKGPATPLGEPRKRANPRDPRLRLVTLA